MLISEDVFGYRVGRFSHKTSSSKISKPIVKSIDFSLCSGALGGGGGRTC